MVNHPFSDVVTEGIRVRAAAQLVPEETDSDRPLYVFTYRIRILNEGETTATLESRHWVIVDANGERRDVRGPGVVGQFPRLGPGDSFEYTSRCPLATSWGTMEGSYRFRRPDGSSFDVAVGRFFLARTAPPIVQQMNA